MIGCGEGSRGVSSTAGIAMSPGEDVPIRVTHVIAGLELGGAEMMLYKLLSASDRQRFAPSVISLSDLGPLAPRIADLGIPVSALQMTRGRVEPRPVGRLARRLAARRPHVVHTWMYHADLLGGAMARATGRARVVWGLRGSVDPHLSKRSSRMTARACTRTSRWLPDRVVSCSERLAEMHIALGYDPARMLVIPNGFDLTRFSPDPALRAQSRRALGAGGLLGVGGSPGVEGSLGSAGAEAQLLVGLVGRYDPQKDHRTFLRAAGELARVRADVRFVMCGPGVDAENRELVRQIAELGIGERCSLLGPVEDPRGVLNALDVLVCSSAFGEGFPNVLGEAMACGVPCVTTDVGDAAMIVAGTGRVVVVGDWCALAREVGGLLELDAAARAELGARARARVQRDFSLPGVARRFEELYVELCS
jgi:glycosyltransferase involved in cell wall biosynthesis